MKFTIQPKTGLGKVSMLGLVYFLLSWMIVAFIQPYLGSSGGGRNFFDWIFILLAISGMMAAFISMIGGLIAIIWREDRSLLGILTFVFSIPICVMLAGFLLGNYMS